MSNWIGNTLIALGVGFAVLGSVGLFRLPDFYSRAHAATKPDTLGLILTMLGLLFHAGFSTTGAKLIGIAVFVAVANPAAAHALGRSALRTGVKPWVRPEEARE